MKNVIYILGIMLIASCQKQVKDFELEDFEPSIVMSGIFQADTEVRIHVTQSISGLEKDVEKTISGLKLELFEDGTFISELEPLGDNYYGNSKVIPEYGKTYEIRATAPNMENASCILEIPEKPEYVVMDNPLSYEYEVYGTDTIYLQISDLSFRVDDPAEDNNYYMFSVKRYVMEYYFNDNGTFLDSTFILRSEYLTSKDNYIEIIDDGNYVYTPALDEDAWGKRFFFSDKLFNGGSHTFKIQNIYFDNAEYYIELCSISKDYFDYISSYSRYTDDPFESFFVEKTSVYSNVQNGLGLIAAINSNIVILDYRNDTTIRPY